MGTATPLPLPEIKEVMLAERDIHRRHYQCLTREMEGPMRTGALPTVSSLFPVVPTTELDTWKREMNL